MWILIVYVLIVVIGEAVVIAIGLTLDRIYPLASLPVSLSLFFAVLAFGWPLAVRWTEPKLAKGAKTRKLKKLRPRPPPRIRNSAPANFGLMIMATVRTERQQFMYLVQVVGVWFSQGSESGVFDRVS